jgi:hypothetical protein
MTTFLCCLDSTTRQFSEMHKNNTNIWDALGISGSTKLPNVHIIEDYQSLSTKVKA